MENNFKMFITGLQHIGIPTNDMEATVSFYEGIGFEAVYRTVNEAADEKVTFLQLGNVMVETYENKSAVLMDGALDHIALDVTDIDAVFGLAKEKGLQMIDTEIQFLPFWKNGVKFFRISGPNKEKIEFNQYL